MWGDCWCQVEKLNFTKCILTHNPIGYIILPMTTKSLLKMLTVGLVGLAVILLLPKKSEAKEVCYTQYGGGETCVDVEEDSELRVDKQIYNPRAGEWENHVKESGGSFPYKFEAEETIRFRIKVENTGDVRIEDIKTQDILPSFLKYRDGDGGGKNDDTRVEFDEFDLDPGQEETFEFRARVADDGVLPNDDRICLTNIAKAEGVREDDDDDEESDVDYANFCIELPEVLGKEAPEKLPVTGFFEPKGAQKILILSLSAGMVLAGYGIRKLAS